MVVAESKDPLTVKLEVLKLSEDEVKKFKEMLGDIKSKGLSVDVLRQFKQLSLCKEKPKYFWSELLVRTTELKVLEKNAF